jgi:hypothetical protein
MPMAANAQMAMIAAQMFDAMSLWLGCTAGLGAAPAGRVVVTPCTTGGQCFG